MQNTTSQPPVPPSEPAEAERPTPPAQHQSVESVETAPKKEARSKKRGKNTMYETIMIIGASLFTVVISFLIWYIGAICTLNFLSWIGLDQINTYAWRWAIPIGITLIEIACWPSRDIHRNLKMVFFVVASLDLVTTAIGGATWIQDRGQTSQPMIWIFSIALAYICAFWPEYLARTSLVTVFDHLKVLKQRVVR